jgi:leader peptidase (prepilin peptidase)/N-methyltransferase
MSPALWIAAALIGPCLGSFATTAALRRASAEQAVRGRSHCDHCGAELSYARTLPVVSFIQLGGACKDCGGKIDITHLVGEIAGGVILISALALALPLRASLLAVLGLALLASSVHDLKTQQLPDDFTALIVGCAAALALLQSARNFEVGLGCAVVCFAGLEAIRRGFIWLRGKPGLGFGDVKLLSALALWLGLATPWAIVGASFIGLGTAILRRSAQERSAFGPSIAAAAWCIGLAREAGIWPSLI